MAWGTESSSFSKASTAQVMPPLLLAHTIVHARARMQAHEHTTHLHSTHTVHLHVRLRVRMHIHVHLQCVCKSWPWCPQSSSLCAKAWFVCILACVYLGFASPLLAARHLAWCPALLSQVGYIHVAHVHVAHVHVAHVRVAVALAYTIAY